MLKTFKKSLDGIAAIEFAILLPLLLVIFFGVVELANYVQIVRKVDTTTNDIAYLLSREGILVDKTTYDNSNGKLEEIIFNVGPFLMYPQPFKYGNGSSFSNQYSDKTPGNAYFGIAYVGLPTNFQNAPNCPDGKINGIDYTTSRLMWFLSNSDAANKSEWDGGHMVDCVGANCPVACNGKPYKSNFQDDYGLRTNIVFPGQSFILFNLSFDYHSILADNPVFGALLPGSFTATDKATGATVSGHTITKVASYAIRVAYHDNGDGIATANEFYNDMQYLTGGCCNSKAGNNNFLETFGGFESQAIATSPARQTCINFISPPPPLGGYAPSVKNSGGCNFK